MRARGAGNRDWGASTLINVPCVSLEAYTGHENFAVCLILSSGAFQARCLLRASISTSTCYMMRMMQARTAR